MVDQTGAADRISKPHSAHPIHIHPVRPLYRFAAVGLGASMWFFVCALLSQEVLGN